MCGKNGHIAADCFKDPKNAAKYEEWKKSNLDEITNPTHRPTEADADSITLIIADPLNTIFVGKTTRYGNVTIITKIAL